MPRKSKIDPEIAIREDARIIVSGINRAWDELENGESPIHEVYAYPTTDADGKKEARPRFESLSVSHQDSIRRNLKLWAEDLAKGSRAKNTVTALRGDLKLFVGWCQETGHIPLPATQETLLAFLDHYGSRRKASTLKRYLASIATLHKAAGLSNPCVTERVKNRLDRVLRQQAEHDKGARDSDADVRFEKRQARGLNDEDLEKAEKLFDEDLIWDLRDRALVWLAYDTMARSSEIASMLYRDITRHSSGEWTVQIKYSKSDQHGAGRDAYISEQTAKYLEQWMRAADISGGRLFRGIKKERRLNGPNKAVIIPVVLDTISRQTVYRAIKKTARRMYDAGILKFDPADYSAHSTRVGAAQDMIQAGIDMLGVQVSGGWKSDVMPQQYASKLNALKGGAAQLARKKGRSGTGDSCDKPDSTDPKDTETS